MKTFFSGDIKNKAALVAGLSILMMAILAGFAYGYVFAQLVTYNNATQTVTSIVAHKVMFVYGLVTWLLVFILDVVLSFCLYFFFKGDGKRLAVYMMLLRLLYAGVLLIAVTYLISVLRTINVYAVDAIRLETAALLVGNSLHMFTVVWSIGLCIFGLHLLLLGYIAKLTMYIPKFIGYLVFFAGVCYLGTSLADIFSGTYHEYKKLVEMILGLPMALGELSLGVWFLWKVIRKSLL